MAKGGGGGGGKRQRKDTQAPKRRKRDEYTSDQDMDDEIDAFHKQRDVVPLDVHGDEGESDEDNEYPVLNLEGDEDDDDDYNHVTGLEGKIVEQQKLLQQKHGGVEDEMHDDAEEEGKKLTWGTRKHMYYNADNIDFEIQSSDDDQKEEEEEVVKIQREKTEFLTREDLGFEDSDEDGSDSDSQRTLEDAFPKLRARLKPHQDKQIKDDTGSVYEEVKKDLNALSKEEQMDVVYSSAPELVFLLPDLNDALDQLERKVNPLLTKVKERNGITKEGIHYLEVKHHLLLAYCQAISFYLLLKSEGQPVRDHPVLARLVEIKSLLEKVDSILPLDIEEVLDQDQETESRIKQTKEAFSFEPDSMNNESLPVSTKTLDASVSQPREIAQSSKVSLSKDVNKQEKHKRQTDHVGVQNMEMLRIRASLEENWKKKGTFTSLAKPDRTQKHLMHPVKRQFETFDDFADEVIDTEGVSGKFSQLVRTKLNKPKVISGDDDLPKRDDIGERRRKHELRVLAQAGVRSNDENVEVGDDVRDTGGDLMDAEVEEDGDTEESEDEFYKYVKQHRAVKLSAKEELYSRKPVLPASAEPDVVDGKRQITYQIQKNRGLTRSRKKQNPRTTYKNKHKKKVGARKGQVRDVKRPSGPYGGEVTGINPGISRSRRFN